MKNKGNKRLNTPSLYICLPCLSVFYKYNRDGVCGETKVCYGPGIPTAREMSVSEICEVSCFSAS